VKSAAIKDADGVGDVWSTPFPIWGEILTRYFPGEHKVFDPCPNRARILSGTFTTSAPSDGLAMPWGDLWFVNPPWSDIAPWVRHARNQGYGVMLIPTRTDQPWFQEAGPVCKVVHIGGRVNYINPETGDTCVRKYDKDPVTGEKLPWAGKYKRGSIACPSSLLIFGVWPSDMGTAEYWTPNHHQERAAARPKKGAHGRL
jgi:DNA N-6-adenine-methyltransferase (Dam)